MAYLTSGTVSRKQAVRALTNHARNLLRQKKIALYMDYLLYCLNKQDRDAAMDGLEILFALSSDHANGWRVAVKAYNADRGDKVNDFFDNLLNREDKPKR